MSEAQSRSRAGPPGWVSSVDAPVWICNLSGRIVYINEQAASLFGHEAADCLGCACHEIVRGVDENGRPHCRRGCENLGRARQGRPIAPDRFSVRSPEGGVRRVAAISASVPGNGRQPSVLVHVALPVGGPENFATFVDALARRTEAERPVERARFDSLTPRQREVLELLARDRTLDEVAAELGIALHTARTHLKNILRRLGAHSRLEAIARYLVVHG